MAKNVPGTLKVLRPILLQGRWGRSARLIWPARGCLIYDLGSSNGTSLNDVPLRGTVLYDGDAIKLGEVELGFEQVESM